MNATITVECPACGSEGYDIDVTDDDNGAEISLPCDDCRAWICVEVDIRVSSRTAAPDPSVGPS